MLAPDAGRGGGIVAGIVRREGHQGAEQASDDGAVQRWLPNDTFPSRSFTSEAVAWTERWASEWSL